MDIWYKYLATNVAIALIMLISGKIFSNRAPKISTLSLATAPQCP